LWRSSAAYVTVVTVVMMCLKERAEIVAEESNVDVQFDEHDRCTITIAVVMKFGAKVVSVCKNIQEEIVNEISMMTPFAVKQVHLIVKKIVFEKNNA